MTDTWHSSSGVPGPWLGPDGVPQRVRIGSYAWAERDGAVLLCRMREGNVMAGHWTMPGGGVSFGEDPVHALGRELEEETGLSGVVGQLLGVRSALLQPEETVSHHRIHTVGILYRLEVTGGELRHEMGGSTDMAAWIPLEDLDSVPRLGLLDWARSVVGR